MKKSSHPRAHLHPDASAHRFNPHPTRRSDATKIHYHPHIVSVVSILIRSEVGVDLVYFDPPYATEFSTTNYETSYHFVEGLMTYWKGLEIDESSRVRKFHSDHRTVIESTAEEFFDGFLGKAKGIKHWIISYRDHAYPNEAKMKKLIEKQGKSSRCSAGITLTAWQDRTDLEKLRTAKNTMNRS